MLSATGPRAHRIYQAIRERIRTGTLAPGARLPGQHQIAEEYGVALMTVRQALSRLAGEGLISIEHGRGMSVRWADTPAVLVVDDDAMSRAVIAEVVEMAGYRAIPASSADAGLRVLESTAISAVLSDVGLPEREIGIAFIKAVRRRWPEIPVAAITGYPYELTPLQHAPECPVLVIQKPFHIAQIEEALRIAVGPRRALALAGV